MLKPVLLQRNYPHSLIDRGIERARKIPRKIALLKVKQKTAKIRPVFAIKYDPRLPPVRQYKQNIGGQ